MKQISISDDDYNFLKELSNELLTQSNHGCADPVYWGVMDYNDELTVEGNGEPRITYDDGAYTLEDAVSVVNDYIEDYSTDIQDAWKEVDKNDPYEVAEFMTDKLKWYPSDVYWVEEKGRISERTGAFLTEKACKEYIKCYGYNHNKAHPYAMTAYRNHDLDRLLTILKGLGFTDGEKQDSD